MELFYYRRLDVYKNVKELVLLTYKALESFPANEQFALISQMRRAVTSIMFNIAEGFGRYGQNERIHFLDIANGSLMETSSQLELAAELKYISQEELNMFDERIVIIVKQLARLRSSIKMQQE